jgi:GNAT superfamily N-acetyltransferase
VLPTCLCVVGYDHPDVAPLVQEVQQEYVRRYGGEDSTPLATDMFVPPTGLFFVVYDHGAAVAMGGWRRHDETRDGSVPGVRAAEVKRMYVTPRARGRGLARALLVHLERTASEAGCDMMVLETGRVQPEALALYRSAGYADIAPFGHYTESELSVHLGKRLLPS